MLKFEENFFAEEEREGFVVSETMKRAWAAEMEVLAEVAAVCKKYNLTWYAGYGTLLGAVRHKGFIPWDDDIDIMLKREDFIKLFSVLPKELPETYGINSIYTSKDHQLPFGSVTNSKRVYRDDARTARFHGCPYVVGVDIYPLDYIPNESELEQTQINLYNAVYDVAQRYDEMVKNGELETYLPKLEALCGVNLNRNGNIPHQLWTLTDQLAGLFGEKESERMAELRILVTSNSNCIYSKKCFEEVIWMPFENIEVSVPVGYHEILSKLYLDYTKPSKWSLHNYPFYEKQEKYLK